MRLCASRAVYDRAYASERLLDARKAILLPTEIADEPMAATLMKHLLPQCWSAARIGSSPVRRCSFMPPLAEWAAFYVAGRAGWGLP